MRFVLPTVLALSSVSSFAADNGAILTLSNHSGFTHPDYARREKCEVFADRVVTTRIYGQRGFQTVTEQKISMTGDMEATLVQVSQEQVETKDNGLCDGPSSHLTASLKKADGAVEELLLFSTGGCGHPSQTRKGPATYALRDVVANHCPKLFEFNLGE